ncbi:hypothetical protein ABH926_002100 [Catenulispora sp. GP43]|uniref:effector-associated domain EAD1-containing protein n=1 Tax=Catenulispora sp. GP43 TaxID=3156263 RepID=UPI0035196EB9
MAPSESMMPPRDPGEEPGGSRPTFWDDGPEINLTEGEVDRFRHALATVYHTEGRMAAVLEGIGYGRARFPVWETATETWQQVFWEFQNGIVDRPWRHLVIAAYAAYPGNAVFRELARHCLPDAPQPQPQPQPREDAARPRSPAKPETAAPPAVVDDVCHVIVEIDDGQDAEQIRAELDRLGLRPEVNWVAGNNISFRVDDDDPITLRTTLDGIGNGYIIVEPGRPDYVLQALLVCGPDGRRFQITGAPAQQTVANIANDVLYQYPTFRDRTRPTVVDLVGPTGQGDRLDPDDTLHDAGIRDGDELRVGFQATAGAVHPQHREEALYRVRNQIVAYAKAHEGFGVEVDWPQLPSEYTLEFRARSFAPNPDGGAEPVEIDRPHRVMIQFGPDFPMTPPQVFWLTPIFHPNVYPMYECEAARNQPHARGLVCLGELAMSYQPSLDFGELCQTLVDIAGFRNYRLFEPTGWVDAHGNPLVVDDFFDEDAMKWAWAHQDRIAAIGGRFAARRDTTTPVFRNSIEPLDQ